MMRIEAIGKPLLRKHGVPNGDADDVLQEACHSVLRFLEQTGHSAPRSLDGFLFHRVRGAYKKLRPTRSALPLDSWGPGVEAPGRPEDRILEHSTSRALKWCVAKLPEEEQRLIDLRIDKDLGLREAARQFGRSEGWASKKLKRVYDKLEACLRGRGIVAP